MRIAGRRICYCLSSQCAVYSRSQVRIQADEDIADSVAFINSVPSVTITTMRVELIGQFKPCMTDIYLHTDARMADYIRTHPYVWVRWILVLFQINVALRRSNTNSSNDHRILAQIPH